MTGPGGGAQARALWCSWLCAALLRPCPCFQPSWPPQSGSAGDGTYRQMDMGSLSGGGIRGTTSPQSLTSPCLSLLMLVALSHPSRAVVLASAFKGRESHRNPYVLPAILTGILHGQDYLWLVGGITETPCSKAQCTGPEAGMCWGLISAQLWHSSGLNEVPRSPLGELVQSLCA